jgi:D-alanyl-D-alanine carboxypeptidase (penicillin-binding protein 5/6)
MKKKIRKIVILTSGLAMGVAFGYVSMVGINKVYILASSKISKINLSFLSKENDKGGPSGESYFSNKTENYISDYKPSYKISDQAPVPKLTADSYLVGDIETGEIILSKNENKAMPMASISKLLTAVVADEKFGLSKDVYVSEFAIDTYGKQGKLVKGEKYKVSEILYPLLLESSNDAAEAVAESADRDSFIMNLNDKARDMEMYNTHFSDPSGLSENNISSVSDLFKLAQYIEKYRKYIFDITRLKQYKIGKKIWFNNSKFRIDDDYYGGKNGYTDEALKTQLAIFEIPFEDKTRKIIFIILKTDDIYGDIYGLKKYVERHVRFE